MEELRLQKLRLREEAARLEKGHAKDTSAERVKRSDAEAARRVAAGTAATGTGETWVDMAVRDPQVKGGGKTEDRIEMRARTTPPWIGPRVQPRGELKAARADGRRPWMWLDRTAGRGRRGPADHRPPAQDSSVREHKARSLQRWRWYPASEVARYAVPC